MLSSRVLLVTVWSTKENKSGIVGLFLRLKVAAFSSHGKDLRCKVAKNYDKCPHSLTRYCPEVPMFFVLWTLAGSNKMCWWEGAKKSQLATGHEGGTVIETGEEKRWCDPRIAHGQLAPLSGTPVQNKHWRCLSDHCVPSNIQPKANNNCVLFAGQIGQVYTLWRPKSQGVILFLVLVMAWKESNEVLDKSILLFSMLLILIFTSQFLSNNS